MFCHSCIQVKAKIRKGRSAVFGFTCVSQRRGATTAAINTDPATEVAAGPEPAGGGGRKFWSGPGEVCFLPSQEKDLNPKQLRDCLATQADSLFVKDLQPGEQRRHIARLGWQRFPSLPFPYLARFCCQATTQPNTRTSSKYLHMQVTSNRVQDQDQRKLSLKPPIIPGVIHFSV